MKVCVETKPTQGFMRDSYGSKSGAYWYRRMLLKFNVGQYGTTPLKPESVVIYHNPQNDMWEVWIIGVVRLR